MTDFLTNFIVILVIGFLMGLSMYFDYSIKAQAAEPVNTEIPVYKAKCSKRALQYCEEYTIYKVTEY